MRWRTLAVWALALAGLTGCPDDFGKDGTMDRAAHQDVLELMRKSECSKEVYEKLCARGREASPECRKACG
jgi:hypothetical protein